MGSGLVNQVFFKFIAVVSLFAAMIFANVHAASVDKGYLGELNSESSITNDLTLSADTLILSQAVNPTTSGFISGNGSGQWRFSPNDGNSLSNISGYYIRFDGAPALLGIPAESGTLTIGANNEIEDVWTSRIFSRPVVFVALEDPSLKNGVSIVPTAPITHGNQFLFDIRMADGFAADLEGATLKYFIAEEGWHHLSDGRMLLISSAELRDTGFTGQTIELGASFQDAVTVAQLQRPMLYKNSLGFRQLNTIEVYQGATVTSGTGDISRISLRMMQGRSVEEANGSTVYGGRVGFMVLGTLTELDNKLHWVKDTSTNIRGGSYLTVPSSNFTNYPHSAATSPLLNKSACAEDDDVQNFCVYMSMPVDMFSRGKFKTPRFPYMDANFQPLTMQRTLYSEHDNWDWTAVLEDDISSPTVDSDGTSITGTLAQLHPNFVADRGWDDYVFGSDFWHWFATYHYNTCTFDSMTTACVDYELGDTIVDDHQLLWSASTTYDNSSQLSGTRGAVWGTPPDLSIEQMLFSVRDELRRDHAFINEFVSAPTWAANQAAAYLNYDLPTGDVVASGLQPEKNYNNLDLDSWMTIHEATSSAWQLHAMTLTAAATEWNCGTCGVTDFGEWRSTSTWSFNLPYPKSMLGQTWAETKENFETRQHVKPVVDMVTRTFRVGDYLFANVPWGIDGSNYRWVRSATQEVANAVTVATGTLGYQAAAGDADQFITMCVTYTGTERCGDWFEVGNIPYATDVSISTISPTGVDLVGNYTYVAPGDGNYDVENFSPHQWQKLVNGAWVDISGATEQTYVASGSAGLQIRFCVTPRSLAGLIGPEECSAAAVVQGDNDSDGIADHWDRDDDNDGTFDGYDAFPFDNTESLDTDGDGIGNNADSDDDNDGISDDDENAGLTDPLLYDTDGDGTNDLEDPFPTSYGNFPDYDNDGLDDTVDEDRDNDGVIDFYYQVEGKPGLQTLIEEGDVVLNWMRYDDNPFDACLANQITVTSNADSGPGTLRQAIADLCASDPAGQLNTITFSEAMTITLESPLLITKGMTIDGNREVVIDGQNVNSLFEVVMTDKLASTQFPHLIGLTLRNGFNQQENIESEFASLDSLTQASAIEMSTVSYLILDFTLIENMTAPVIGGEHYELYMDNSLIANVTGDQPALVTVDGHIALFSSTIYNSESGIISVLGDGEAQLRNSLLLNGPTGSTVCNVATWVDQTTSWVEDSECGISSTGTVELADPDNGDYRPLPGSANIDIGTPGDQGQDTYDLLGVDRIMGEYNPDNPVEEGGPIYPQLDVGAIEYDFYGDFDGDGAADTVDAFPIDATETTDTDGDNVGDNADAFPNDPTESVDSDSDGTGNNTDPDDDNDGVNDGADAFPLDGTEWLDTDGDGTGDNADIDDDNNGIMDAVDQISIGSTEPEEPQGTAMTFSSGDGEQVVLAFTLTSTETGNEVRAFTLATGGDLDPANDIAQVRLYRDDNEDGVADPGELLEESSFELAGGLLTLTLAEAYPLPMGESRFLVTYEF